MPREKLPNQPNPDPDLFDKLFGDPADLSELELNALYKSVAPGSDPAAIVHKIAESAAVEYRLQNRVPPDHVQATLDAIKEIKTLDEVPRSKLQQIVDTLTDPFLGPVDDPAFAYRNRSGELVS